MEWVTNLITTLGYPGIVVAIALENLFPPIPSEVLLPLAGFHTVNGTFTLPGVVAAATVGSLLGAMLLYGVGQVLGRERLYGLVRRWGRYLRVQEADLQRAEAWFQRYGPWTVFFCRMVPILRSLISIPAGLANMAASRFLLYTAAGTLIWNTALAGAGAALGSAWPLVASWISYYQTAVVIAAVVAVTVFLGTRFLSRRRS